MRTVRSAPDNPWAVAQRAFGTAAHEIIQPHNARTNAERSRRDTSTPRETKHATHNLGNKVEDVILKSLNLNAVKYSMDLQTYISNTGVIDNFLF